MTAGQVERAGPALAAQQLAFGYGREPLFAELSLAVGSREIVCLLGGSGCGKSSLLRVLAGLAPPRHGRVSFLGAALTSPHPHAALLFQQPSLLPWLNVRDNVAFGLSFARQPREREPGQLALRVQRALRDVGLQGREQAYPAELSGGMAQRVALARALAREPRLLFADEPFSALDAVTRAEMQELLVRLVQSWQTAALLVTHDLDEALRVADRVLLMGAPAPQRPACILREWLPGSPVPRDTQSSALLELRSEILGALRAERRSPQSSLSGVFA